jgi:3-keto-5-aminohexanoate cleavage enzyme
MIEIKIGLVSSKMPNIGIDVVWPLELEPKINTMNKKLIINVAPTGALISRKQNPLQPYTTEEIAKEAIESYKEGATMFHVHCRDNGRFTVQPELYKKTMDLVFAKAPDMITNLCTIFSPTHEGPEWRLKPIIEPLLKFGSRYCEIAVINPVPNAIGQEIFVATPLGLQEECKFMQDNGVKPEYAAYSLPALETIQHAVIDTGIAKKPYFISILAGIHNATPSTPDPEGLLGLIHTLRYLPPDTVWEVTVGGRNWLPLTVAAITLGADLVRVGMEDTVHLYPHRDDPITNCAQVVKKIATIAKELGREIATPDEARKILGIKH